MSFWYTAWTLVRTHLSSRVPPVHKNLKVKLKVDDVVDAIAAIDQTDMSAEEDVTETKPIEVELGYKASCPSLGRYSKGKTYSAREVLFSECGKR